MKLSSIAVMVKGVTVPESSISGGGGPEVPLKKILTSKI